MHLFYMHLVDIMKILPIKFPPIETYQAISFVLAVMMAHDNVSNSIYNKYIRIHGYNSNEMEDLLISFDDALWEEYCKEGIVDLDFYNTKNLSIDSFAEFLQERIDQNCYICLYHVDDYYLSHTDDYRSIHFPHDLYIYGYTDDYFVAFAYKGEHLQMINIPKTEVVEAVFMQENEEDRHFCTMKVLDNIYVEIDYERIMTDMKVYYEGSPKDTTDMKYGIETYSLIKNALVKSKGRFDMRVFRMIWEHKKLMLVRFNKLNETIGNDKLLVLCEKIEKQAYTLFLVALKYAVNPSEKQLFGIMDSLNELELLDRKFGKEILELQHILVYQKMTML